MAAHVLDRDDDLELERLAGARIDDRDLAVRPDRRRGTGRSPRAAAAWPTRPIRCGGGAPSARSASSRSRHRARWAPRFVPAIAWTSSTITCSTPRSTSRAWLVSIRYRLSGVVTRMSGGAAGDLPALLRRACRRSGWRREIRGGASPRRWAASADAGERRAQVALHVVGQGLERRDVQDADAGPGGPRLAAGLGCWARRSRHHRNAARVLPLPVGRG